MGEGTSVRLVGSVCALRGGRFASVVVGGCVYPLGGFISVF